MGLLPSGNIVDIMICFVGFEVLTSASMKMAVFWVVAPCTLVEVYRRFRDAFCLLHQGDKRTAVRTSNPTYFICGLFKDAVSSSDFLRHMI
jgi:hypothetical protein